MDGVALLERLDRDIAKLDERLSMIQAEHARLKTAREVLVEILKIERAARQRPPEQRGRTSEEESRDRQAAADNGNEGATFDFSDGATSIPEAAKLILARAGRPLKAREIADALVSAGFPTKTTDMNDMRNNVAGTLGRRIRVYRDPELEKVGTAFGLTTWRRNGADERT